MASFQSLLLVATFSMLSCVLLASGMADRQDTDRIALLEVKANIADPEGVLTPWNNTTPLCGWPGIVCGRKHRRVTLLDLSSRGLSGVLSPHVGNLSFLREIYLQNNSFQSTIPSEITNLKRLRILYLHNNSFTGQIPLNLSRWSSIVAINLGRNRLVGNLPTEIGSLSKLRMLSLQVNNLVGNIPPSLANLSTLQHFNIYRNNLNGPIPKTLGKLKNLTFLSAAMNNLSGSIPRSIFNITSLKVLELSLNQLEGTLPTDIGITLPNIVAIGMTDNMLSGSIPKTFPNASNIAQISIALNYFTGDVPSFAEVTGMLWLNIGLHQLGNGKSDDLRFICSLTNSTILAKLGVEGNNFGGAIPECIGNLSGSLRELGFSENKISGTLPASIGNLAGLEILLAWGNRLQGNIPSSIGLLKNLNALHLHKNLLSGPIPSSLGNLEMLVQLHLARNNLHDSIPSTLGSCKSLQVLDLSENNLSGFIPPEILKLSSLSIVLFLSWNNLTGPLPEEVGMLTNLNELDLSGNKLSGVIPATIGSCGKMLGLYLDENFFEGPIPSSLESLRGLKVLNISSNRLSGPVPEFLQFLNLTDLSLSYNYFEGDLPTRGVFGNSSSVSVVGNTKLCGGLPEFHLPKCLTKDSRKFRLSRLAKILIFTFLGLFVAIGMLATVYLLWYRQRRKSIEPSSSEGGLLRVSYHSLLKATDGFSSENLIGIGNFGSVYKGFLDHVQMTVAIKVFNLTQYGATRSFVAECETLRNVKHRNLVKVLSACSGFDHRGDDFKALVYEFLLNSSLDEWLHPTNGERRKLNLIERLNIVFDVACALDYLHNNCVPPIVHCDLKPSNVLLNNDMVGHVSDFGLARFLPDAVHKLLTSQTSSIGLKGSPGYIAPEYGMGGQVAAEGDVYSYGVLILEMFTGKRPTDDIFRDGFNLHLFAEEACSAERVVDIIDAPIIQEMGHPWSSRFTRKLECLNSIMRIGVTCSSESPRDRPRIMDVVGSLEAIKDTLIKLGR